MSLISQLLIPLQITVPCIYPSSSFNYNFRLFDSDILKVHLDPYPSNLLNHRFFDATVEYAGIVGSGNMYVKKEDSCDKYPDVKMSFSWNNSDYLLQKSNDYFTISNATVELNTTDTESGCGYNHTLVIPLIKRQNLADFDSNFNPSSSASTTTACPSKTQYISLGIAVDCSVSQQSKNDVNAMEQEVLQNLAKTNVAYAKFFNVQLILTDLIIRTSCSQKYTGASSPIVSGEFDKWNQPCSSEYGIGARISDFSLWRSQRKDAIDLWHLFSTCSSDGKVGLAWPSAVCNNGATTATGNLIYSGTSISTRQQNSWKVMAHEIAHNFGAIHDCLSPTCDGTCHQCSPTCNCNNQYLMNPNQNVATDDFSPGTILDVCNTIPSFKCMKSSMNITTFKTNTCGNGIVDPGEECDCGDLCDVNKCCNSQCKFTTGSVCSDTNQGCCNNCQFSPANSVCRLKESICDVEEQCNGNSGDCPTDVYGADGTSCTDNGFKGNCASKYCTSADKQCINAYSTSTGACSGFGTNECILTCSQNGGCAQYASYLIDGTLCGGGYGLCEEGTCAYANGCNIKINLGASFMGFVTTYQTFFIIGGVVLGLLLLKYIYNKFRNKKRNRVEHLLQPDELEKINEQIAKLEAEDEINSINSTAIVSPTRRRAHEIEIE